jgi:AraC-like DNA-binding protein
MTESGAANFTSPDDYLAGIRGATVKLALAGPGEFEARLTWLKLRELQIFYIRESLPRIAYISLAPERHFVSFPLSSSAPLIWNGTEIARGDFVVHAQGERSHQRTKGASKWGLVSLALGRLAPFGKATKSMSPPLGRVLRPSRAAAAHFRRLHSKACHLADTRPKIIADQGFMRSLEQELTYALSDCLTRGGSCHAPATRRRHAEIMIRLEDALTAQIGEQPSMSELCTKIGVPERTLRAFCEEALGMSPGQYLRLCRLNMVHSALLRADPGTARVAEIAQRYQFSELGRFAATYRAVFGETPSNTLRRSTIKPT